MIYRDDISPPQTYEAVERIAERLRSDATLDSGLGGAGRIFVHRAPAEKPDRYIVIREPVIPGGRPEHFTRVDAAPVQVMAECSENHPNPAWWLSAVHTRIYEVLSGRRLAIESGRVMLPIKRAVRPSGAAYDADDHAYYASAEYRVTLGPIINETP